jgi:hypothetical protein
MAKLLPIAMAAQSLVAGAIYLGIGDWRRGLYWLFAAGIAIVVAL